MTVLETLHEKKARAGHLGGRPRSLTFDEILAKGHVDKKLFEPLGAAHKHIKNRGGNPQLNIGGVRASIDALRISNNLRHLKRLARQQMNQMGG